jgi:hypothetical protein
MDPSLSSASNVPIMLTALAKATLLFGCTIVSVVVYRFSLFFITLWTM